MATHTATSSVFRGLLQLFNPSVSPCASSSSSASSVLSKLPPAMALSPTLPSVYSTPSSLSSFEPSTSSPLSAYTPNRTLPHLPNGARLYHAKYSNMSKAALSSSGNFSRPNSTFLQSAHLLLHRLAEDCCTFCWATDRPGANSHTIDQCELFNNNANFKLAFTDFRYGINVLRGMCYGCYIPNVWPFILRFSL